MKRWKWGLRGRSQAGNLFPAHCGKPSALSPQPSALSHQPSAFCILHSAFCIHHSYLILCFRAGPRDEDFLDPHRDLAAGVPEFAFPTVDQRRGGGRVEERVPVVDLLAGSKPSPLIRLALVQAAMPARQMRSDGASAPVAVSSLRGWARIGPRRCPALMSDHCLDRSDSDPGSHFSFPSTLCNFRSLTCYRVFVIASGSLALVVFVKTAAILDRRSVQASRSSAFRPVSAASSPSRPHPSSIPPLPPIPNHQSEIPSPKSQRAGPAWPGSLVVCVCGPPTADYSINRFRRTQLPVFRS